MKTSVILISCFLFCACGAILKRDLVSTGQYRLEIGKLEGFKLVASVVEKNGKLVVAVRSVGERVARWIGAEAEVALVSPEGQVLEKKTGSLRVVRHRRTSPHLYLRIKFESLPPEGTLIRITPGWTASSTRTGLGRMSAIGEHPFVGALHRSIGRAKVGPQGRPNFGAAGDNKVVAPCEP